MRTVLQSEGVEHSGQEGDATLVCEVIRWKGREATRIANSLVEVIVLAHGGHIASLRCLSGGSAPDVNLMWEAPWQTLDAVEEWSENLLKTYGPSEIGRYLAGYTGHALCLDYFGPPSPAGVAAGRSLHGEAAVTRWKIDPLEADNETHLHCTVDLRNAGLRFERTIHLGSGESVIYVEETVSNLRNDAHLFDWVQHVTFGPPFLGDNECTLEVSARRGITSAESYDNRSLLKPATEFEWPMAPHESGSATVDLRHPFSAKGGGFLAGLQLDPDRKQEFLAAINWNLRLGIAYCFRQPDFPWMTVWEENGARSDSPWKGTTAARGMEFGTSPLPIGEQEPDIRRKVFDLKTGCEIPANGRKTARYMIAVFQLPDHVKSVSNIEAVGDQVILHSNEGTQEFSVAAAGGEHFLSDKEFFSERTQ